MKQQKTSHIVEILDPQHSCYAYEDSEVVITVWSKKKKRMRRFEVNTWLDVAKADVMRQIIGFEK